MSQRAFLTELDATMHQAFARTGMADNGLYTAPDAEAADPAVPVRVYVDRNVQAIGEFNQILANRVEVVYVRADVLPVKGGRLVVDGETFVNVETISDDGSLSRWVVRRG